MKIASVAEVKAHLSAYLKASEQSLLSRWLIWMAVF